MLKKEIRKKYLQKRKALTPAEKQKLDDLLLIQLQKVSLPPTDYLLSFAAIEKQNEPNTFLLEQYVQFLFPHLTIAFPKSNFSNGAMQAIAIDEHTYFEDNNYGIPEPISTEIVPPENIDLIFVPLLCFDKKGFRVGYGKGFYDRYLPQCTNATTIGISYFEPIDVITDTLTTDIPLHYCITSQSIYEFKK